MLGELAAVAEARVCPKKFARGVGVHTASRIQGRNPGDIAVASIAPERNMRAFSSARPTISRRGLGRAAPSGRSGLWANQRVALLYGARERSACLQGNRQSCQRSRIANVAQAEKVGPDLISLHPGMQVHRCP